MQNLNSATQIGSQQEQQLADVQDKISKLEDQLKQFTSIDPNVIVRPFRSEAKSIATIQPSAVDYFVPAVIALLIQHLTVTLAALSIVRERTIGTMELFRVSPLSAGEALFGKYLSYLIFGILLVAVLSALLILGLKMPMLGSYLNYALVIVILIFTSLGFGFFISMVSQTDTQAVQFTMIMLLASVFFSGFMMNLDMIWKPVRVLSWSLPTTYGIITLRNIMLRGDHPDLMLVGGLFLIGIGFLIVNWLLLRRLTSPRVD
jgi:ABC-2 type transport system permease protein